MATTDLVPTSIISATGWTGATVANLDTSDDSRATDGTASELISAELTDSPGDFSSQNSVTLHVEARVVGTVSRQKQVLVELLDSGDTVLESFTTSNLTSSDVQYDSSAFSRTDSASVIDGYRLRCTVQESGGMGDSATVEIDKMWVTLDYNAASTDRAARVSAFELETPLAPRRARVSAFELEVPLAPRRARVSAFELEVPTAPRRARVSAFELEVPLASRRGRVSAFEFEVPSGPRSARVSAFELEVPLVGAAGGSSQRGYVPTQVTDVGWMW